MEPLEFCPLCALHCPLSAPQCAYGRRQERRTPDERRRSRRGGDPWRGVPGGDCTEQRLLVLFGRLAHIFHHRMSRDQGKDRVLSILRQHGAMTQRELLEHAGVRSASLSELLRKIEGNGDIVRARSVEDSRNIDIRLTDKGLQDASEAENEQVRSAKLLFSALTPEEQEQLEALLEKLLLSWAQTLRGGRP